MQIQMFQHNPNAAFPVGARSSDNEMQIDRMKIGTHSGTFHCDEVLACFMLKQLPEFSSATIVRSRDPSVLETCDIVVDVGSKFDHEKRLYDHHQRDFNQYFSDKYDIKLSSAGLIYKYYGKQVIATLTSLKEPELEMVYQRLYESFVLAVDALDNGVSQYPTEIEPRYSINTDLGSRVSHLNPSWREEGLVEADERFQQAMQMAGAEFVQKVKHYAEDWFAAREIVRSAVENRFEFDPSGDSILLPRFCPYQEHVFMLEEELQLKPILYCIFEDTSHQWRIRAIAARPGSFECRQPLPEKWRGIRDAELDQLVGVSGCVFVHHSGFIGGHRNRDGIVAMLRRAKEESGATASASSSQT